MPSWLDPDTSAGRFGFFALLLVVMAVMYALFDRTGFLIVAIFALILAAYRLWSRSDRL